MRLKIGTVAAVILLAAAGLAWAWWPKPDAIRAGRTAPDFVWVDAGGEKHHLSDLQDKAVVLHFWAAWCLPCLDELPKLLEAAQSWPKNVVLITVSADENRELAQHFLDQKAARYKGSDRIFYAYDPDRALTYDTFQTAMFPETVLLDSAHHLRRKFAGPVEWQGADAKSAIAALGPQK